jgi:hypothetical protein
MCGAEESNVKVNCCEAAPTRFERETARVLVPSEKVVTSPWRSNARERDSVLRAARVLVSSGLPFRESVAQTRPAVSGLERSRTA